MAQSILRPVTLRRFAPVNHASTGARAVHPYVLRALLSAGCAIAVGLALWVGDPGSYLQADPPLARLLRCMALIKGAIAAAALGAAWWRSGWPISPARAASYVLGSSMLAGSAMLIWQLTLIALAAMLFHAALLGMLLVAWRDR